MDRRTFTRIAAVALLAARTLRVRKIRRLR
jgi:hypothetical protein